MATFLGELQEHARALERDLLALEKGPESAERTELINTLFRTAHSLKGAARSVDIGIIETACHQLEEVFAAARDGQLALDGTLFELLLATADALRETGMLLERGQAVSAGPLAAVVPRLVEASSDVVAFAKAAGTPAKSVPVRSDAGNTGSPADSEAPVLSEAVPREPQGQESFVRLTTGKLDRLLAESSDLLLARNRLERRLEQIDQLKDAFRGLRTDWSRIGPKLRRNGDLSGGALTTQARGAVKRGEAAGVTSAAAALTLYRDDLKRIEHDLEELASGFRQDCRALGRSASGLQAEVHQTRMMPLGEACEGLGRMVRDLSAPLGKAVVLVVNGSDIEIDRAIIDAIRDPLRHLVRNAVDHAIEPVEIRRDAGKSETGHITVEAVLRGAQVEISVTDDGRGLDVSAIREHARKRNLPGSESEDDLLRHIFVPGFSTAPMITELSGRGVGLDVVKTQIEALRGTVNVSSDTGYGTGFTLSLPLTLATIRALLITSGGQTFAIDTASIRQLLRVKPSEIQSLGGRSTLVRGTLPMPAARLSHLLSLPGSERLSGEDLTPCVVIAAGVRDAALIVDDVQAEREMVVKSLGPRLAGLRNYSGGTVLPDGAAALILNCADLVAAAYGQVPTIPFADRVPDEARQQRILVADDSVTTRTMEKSILEAAGYEVMTAADGAEAWSMLQDKGADLVVSDVEMPRMDGFSLAEAIRGSHRFKEVPVILVTARESEEDRARGLRAGADAYLGKSAFDQRGLLDAVSQLLRP